MAIYTLSKRLPSSEIDKQLAKEIEAYIKGKLPDKGDDKYENCYVVKIVDSIGSESLNSIEGMVQDTFPNDIESFELSGNAAGSVAVKIDIRFGKTYSSTEIRLTVNAENAKEKIGRASCRERV